MNYLYVFLGGGIGSMLRYGISVFTIRNVEQKWAPLAGTFGANILACILLAILVKGEQSGALSRPAFLLLGTGLCGGFSTFSTFSLETFAFWSRGDHAWAIANVLVSVTLGFAAMWLLLKSWPSA
ncbi:fluoride efflux transporter CrcB [Phaeocystidibacter luteus]|uniref:Fluoride-specific ion channel FluC n=1 Tax=Phaeocystidibacter luteus TaxID=911197 RepID=A0A6N6RGS4_9FLAO|nr:fluoride efflux transporter CrcB [Phaeocystidibacter luteus]KAB2810376.1 fluoride efflux transporter CrcB [Phaeocystidibacter luteus]